MRYFFECVAFGATFSGAFFLGALHPVLAMVALAVWLFVLLPRFWRITVIHNAEVDYRRRKANIETQLIRGKLDSQLIAKTADEMKRSGRL